MGAALAPVAHMAHNSRCSLIPSGRHAMRTLYIVGTPIGNLEDVTLRALRILREVGLIAAEDTRVTRRLLARYDIDTPLVSYHEHSGQARREAVLAALREGDVALVCDAGMPAINDPGPQLARDAAAAGASVVIVPGPSALTAALAVSGIRAPTFTHLGFLPRRAAERRRLLESLARHPAPLVAFETPHRLRAALQDALDALGDRGVAVCRELTKLHEETFRGTLSQALAHFTAPRGEFTLVIEGAPESEADAGKREDAARRLLSQLRAEGATARDAAARAASECGVSRSAAYRLWLESGQDAEHL